MCNSYLLKVVRADSVIWEATLHRRVPDLYVEVTLDGVHRKTRTIKSDISPIWNETLSFPSVDESLIFKLQLKHDSRWSSDPCVGYTTIKPSDLLVKCANREVSLRLLSASGAPTTSTGILILHLQVIDVTPSVEINVKNAGVDIQQRGIVRSAAAYNSLTKISEGASELTSQGNLYQAIGCLLSRLEVFKNLLDVVSNVHPFLNIAWQVTSVLYASVAGVFETDKRVVELVRTMESAFAFVRDAQELQNKVRSLQEPIIDLLKQTTECCLFVREYTRHGFLGRMLNSTISTKVDEFEQSFASLKNGIESGVMLYTAFVSARISQGVDDLLLHQWLNPTSTEGFQRPVCLPGTRVEVQRKVIDWMFSETKQNIFWLYGVAGSGKSTVSMSIAEYFRGLSRLGATMFFARGKSDPSAVIRTLAYKLASFDSSIGSQIHTEVERDKDILAASSTSQFKSLLLRPLKAVSSHMLGPIVIVIDALDECGTPESRRGLMQLFRRDFSRLPNNFRFLITSRHEVDIDKALSSQPDAVYTLDLDYTSTTSRRDVLSYFRSEMYNVVQEQVEVPDDWPWDEQMALLGSAAGGLFIWASTAIKLVSSSDNPLYALKCLVSDSTVVTGFGLNELYATVLRQSGIGWSNGRSRDRFVKVMALILFSKVPLSTKTIDGILGFPSEEPSLLVLSRLQSVLRHIPGEPVSLFHASFSDYLMSPERSFDPWFIDISIEQQFIATRCFAVMEDMLRFNICDLETSFGRNVDVIGLDERIKLRIPPNLEYACLYWSQHLRIVPYSPDLHVKLSAFVYRQLLFWFEALSLLKAFSRVASLAFRDTISWLPTQNLEIISFLKDANKLAMTFALPISQSTPHIYVSMLPLTRDDSMVSAHYLGQVSSTIKVKRKGKKPPSPWKKALEGHSDYINSVAFSPDGRLIVSGSDDNTVRIWDVGSEEETSCPILRHDGQVFSVSFSPDGCRIVSGSEDRTVRVWNAQNGELILGPLEGHSGVVYCATFSQDGASFLSGSDDRAIRVWDAEDGRLVLGPLARHRDAVRSAVFSPDGKLIVSGSEDSRIIVWDAKTGNIVVGLLAGHINVVISVCFSTDGKHFASGSMDGTIKVWAVESLSIVSNIVTNWTCVVCVMFSRDGTRIASGTYDGEIAVRDVKTGSLVSGPFEGYSVTCIALSPDEKNIVSGSSHSTIMLWDVDNTDTDSTPSVGHSSLIWSVAASSDGSRIVTGPADKTTIVWNTLDGTVSLGPLEEHIHAVRSVAFSSDSALIASGSDDRTIIIWEATNGMIVFGPLVGHTSTVTSIAFSPDDTLVASGSCDNTIRLWSASKGELAVEPLVGHTGAVNCVSFSPDGALVASASDDRTIRIWDSREATLISEMKGHTDRIRSVNFSPNGRSIVTGADGSSIMVWNVESGKIVAGPFKGLGRYVWSTIFSSDNLYVISGGEHRTIRIWSVTSGQLVCKLVGHSNSVSSLAISPDGNRLFSGSYDKSVRVWDLGRILRPHHSEDNAGAEERLAPVDSKGLTNWALGENGWILGGPHRNDLFLWISPDIRPTLLSPQNTAIFSCPFTTELDFTGATLGDRWTECFTPLNDIQSASQ